MQGFTGMVWGNARFNRYDGCVMHGLTGMMGAECTVSPKWWVWNARFNRYDGCVMHGSTGMMGA